MCDHDDGISYSHWRMFRQGRQFSNEPSSIAGWAAVNPHAA